MIYLFLNGLVIAVMLDLSLGRIAYMVTIPLIIVGVLTQGWPVHPQTLALAGGTYAAIMTIYLATKLRGRVAIWDGDATLCAAIAPVVGWPGIAWVLFGGTGAAWLFITAVTRLRGRVGPETVRMAPFFALSTVAVMWVT